jgi:hypothetical protein
LAGAMLATKRATPWADLAQSMTPANAASLGVIAKFGFRRIGEHIDPEDGLEHIFLRDVAL